MRAGRERSQALGSARGFGSCGLWTRPDRREGVRTRPQEPKPRAEPRAENGTASPERSPKDGQTRTPAGSGADTTPSPFVPHPVRPPARAPARPSPSPSTSPSVPQPERAPAPAGTSKPPRSRLKLSRRHRTSDGLRFPSGYGSIEHDVYFPQIICKRFV